MSETKHDSGVCEKIEESGDWTTFHINIGGKWPLRIATKKPELIELGRAASKSGGEFVWTYTESQGNPNPHNPGTFYMNRYLEAVEPATAGTHDPEGQMNAIPGSAGVPPPSADGMTKEDWARKDSAADKRACIAIAVSALTSTMPADPSAADLNKFIERTAHLSAAWHASVQAIRNGDDEIPFD